MASMFKFIQPFQLTGNRGRQTLRVTDSVCILQLDDESHWAEQQYNSYLFRNNLISDLNTDEFVAKKAILTVIVRSANRRDQLHVWV